MDFPKDASILKQFIALATTTDSLILDFFAGSCSTAQAVLELNHEDGGNRRFIMVQLPEPTGRDNYPNIAEVGKERIRKVITRMKQRADGQFKLNPGTPPQDLGFKVFKLAKPHIRPWDGGADRDPDTYADKLSLFNDPLAPGWTPENVLWEVALREGYGLNTRFVKKTLAGAAGSQNTIWEVADPDTGQQFVVCLDDEVRAELSRHCELTADTLLVCRDIALDDTAAANLSLQCRLKTI